MKAFRAIIALTFRNAVRSHIFQLLLILLLLCVTVIPFSVSVGKPEDLIRVSLLYSLWSVSIILALSSLWLGCYVMSHDIDSYQIHMVVSKPVSRITIWIGKWLGINLLNFILLFVAMLTVYGMVMFRYHSAGKEDMLADRELARQNARAEKARIRSQVLVGRKSFLPERPDAEAVANDIVRRRSEEAAKAGKPMSEDARLKMRDEIKSRIEQKMPDEVLPGISNAQTWVFKDVPSELNKTNLTLRFRPYLGKVASEDQNDSFIQWGVQVPAFVKTAGEEGAFVYGAPEMYFTGTFHEKDLPQGVVSEDGVVKIRAINLDRAGGKHYYQVADGPKLLIPVCSFEMNYLRAMLVMMIQLLLLSGLACAFGGFLTMPTAVFMVASYLLFGALSMVLTDPSFFTESAWDKMGQSLAQMLLLIVIPLQHFDVTDLLSGGDLIEFAFIGELFYKYFLLRGVPLFVFGIWLYWRREMGSAVRK